MPTNATDTDAWVGNVQRPNNGELADSASLAQGLNPLTQRTRHLYNKARGALFDITRAPFNADATGATVSTIAMQAAIDAAAAAGGHVFAGPGLFRHGFLTIPQNVSIFGVPNKTFFSHEGGGDGLNLVNLGAIETNPATIEDIRFIGTVAGTGTHVLNSDQRRQFIRCTWNGVNPTGFDSNNLQGKLLLHNSSNSQTDFIDCRIKVAGSLRGLDVSNGRCRVVRGTMTMPASYAEALVYAGGSSDVEMSAVHVDGTPHSSGSAKVLQVPNNTARARMIGCQIDANVAATTYGFWWEEGALVVARGNEWNAMSASFAPYATNRAAVGSQVELLPTLAIDAGAVPAIDSTVYGSRTYQSLLVKNNLATPTTIQLPQGIVPGQVLHFTYYALQTQSISFVGTPVSASALPGSGTLNAGNTLTGTFVWESRDVSTSYRWVQKGTWGVGLTLV
jgi:hypothetical protein